MQCFDRRRKILCISRVFFALLFLSLFFCSCTDYERMGVNPRPFNEPVSWENNPYGDVFKN